MNNRMNWINRRWRLGLVLLLIGVVLAITGLVFQKMMVDLPFNPRLISGLGILFLGVGAASLVRFGSARNDPQAASRLVAEERDERAQLHRAQAGNRAYWVSAAMAYIVLMWESFSSNGSLPVLSSDVLWFFLAAVVVVPFGVYAASLIYDQSRG